jgi:hypothetical protein
MARIRVLAACALCIGSVLPGVSLAQQPSVDPIPVGTVTDKLGVKSMVNAPRELDLGHSVTTTLEDPKKLSPYIKGMHQGARVTITCVGPNRVRVEAEEMEPVEQRSTVTLRVAVDGSLSPMPDASKQPKPPTG